MLETEITKIQGATITLSKQQIALENASINISTLNAMQNGASTLKAVHNNLYVNIRVYFNLYLFFCVYFYHITYFYKMSIFKI
jgi:hypothetical protein